MLRLQQKVLKLKEVSFSNISKLTSRGIKSSKKDPIKIVQKILDKIFNHLLFYVENEFNVKFSKWSPSVGGIGVAINRIKDSKVGIWKVLSKSKVISVIYTQIAIKTSLYRA